MKKIFGKKTSHGGRAFILLAIALALFIFDRNFHCFSTMRTKVSFVAVSVQHIVNSPIELFSKIADNFISKKSLLRENNRLNAEALLAKVRLQRLDFLEHENSQLRSLLHYSKQIKGKVLAAQLLLSVVDKFGQQVTIDKGEQDGVYIGQPVLDASGLLGQVIAIKDNVSKVLLITNRKSAIPVMIIRNELRAIAVGMADGDYLELINVSETVDIKEGDSLVTSGLERHFPAGCQVGVVKEIKHIIGERFVKVLVVPTAHVNSGNLHVLLIWPDLIEKNKSAKKTVKKSK